MRGTIDKTKKKTIIHAVLLLCLCIVGAAAVELLYFNFHPLFDPSPKIEIQVKDGIVSSNTDNVSYAEDNKWFRVQLPEAYYYRKVSIRFTNKKPQKYKINWTGKDIYGEAKEESTKDLKQRGYKKGVTNLNDEVSKISIELYGKQRSEISSIKITNSLQINKYRLLWLFTLYFCVFFILWKRKWFEDKIHWVFFILAFVLCLNYWYIEDIMQSGWDENVHFTNSYAVAFGQNAWMTKTIQDYADLPEEIWANTYEEHRMIWEYYNEAHTEHIGKENIGRAFTYKDILYLPYIILLCWFSKLGLGFSNMYFFTKLGSMLCYLIIMTYAIKRAKIGKLFLLATGMMPTRLFINSTYNYDSLTVAFLTLGFVFWLNELLEPEKKITVKKVVAIVLCFVMGSLVKQVYLGFILLMVFLPDTKFKSKKQKWGIIGGFICLAVIIAALMTGQMISSYLNHVNMTGDRRGGNTSVSGQLGVVLHHPFAYIQLLFREIKAQLGEFLLGRFPYVNFSFHRRPATRFGYITAIIMLMLFFFQVEEDEKREPLVSIRHKIAIFIIVLLSVMLIWTSMYFAYTPVGANEIKGVQARYYAPLIYPLMCIAKNNYMILKARHKIVNWIMTIVIVVLNLYCVYTICFVPWSV